VGSNVVCNGGGVTALAVTPRGEFEDLQVLQGFKSRYETLAHTGPHSRIHYCPSEAATKKEAQLFAELL